ncbi:10396_t:CDS:2, partial [Scutellospora calospora]
VNKNEVKAVEYVSLDELYQRFKDPGDWKFTPWFKLISEKFLFTWWKNLDNIKSNKDEKIHKLGFDNL